ncbi:hypothetical protein F0U61_16825 [Archangium violaceum]|uniref:hypothetical protein n=1 Tax=Archangium violaceum TaxID=83451 RepID=UPI002B3069F9|nr:hypothetical protein F0U61_16825 [Archangium violaceum]
MFRHTPLAVLGLALAASATGTQLGNTRLVLERVNTTFFIQRQCQPTSTASLAPNQVTGLDELPAALRHLVLADLPAQAVGSSELAECQDLAAQLVESRLRALCWPEARVTSQGDTATGVATALPRLSVQLGAPSRIGSIFVSFGGNPKVSPGRIVQAANSALPQDRACTVSTIEEMRSRVSKLGTFHQVKVVKGPPDEREKNKVPLIIDVAE